ncbi:MAG: hypothetical protein AB7G47_13925 [Mycolicibacterium sp.]|uniref:hypothetical protein n=1 Tax=Mycolicibacterium sp. TaxID=2320850 RepID=UPI003D14920F
MNTTNPTTWHDLRDQLTPDQIEYLESWDANPDIPVMSPVHGPVLEEHRRGSLYFAAKKFVETNAATGRFAHVPMPPDARVVDGWHLFGDDEFDRHFDGTTRRDNTGVRVYISGRQYQDGRVERVITVTGPPDNDDVLTAAEARAAARMLLEAADELDKLG